jgi:hypothetical protein
MLKCKQHENQKKKKKKKKKANPTSGSLFPIFRQSVEEHRVGNLIAF